MLVGISAVDPPSLVFTAVTLILVAWLASLLPVRRALQVNPLEVLRED